MVAHILIAVTLVGPPGPPAPACTLLGPPVQARWSGTIAPASTADAPLRLVADVPLPGSASRFDYRTPKPPPAGLSFPKWAPGSAWPSLDMPGEASGIWAGSPTGPVFLAGRANPERSAS